MRNKREKVKDKPSFMMYPFGNLFQQSVRLFPFDFVTTLSLSLSPLVWNVSFYEKKSYRLFFPKHLVRFKCLALSSLLSLSLSQFPLFFQIPFIYWQWRPAQSNKRTLSLRVCLYYRVPRPQLRNRNTRNNRDERRKKLKNSFWWCECIHKGGGRDTAVWLTGENRRRKRRKRKKNSTKWIHKNVSRTNQRTKVVPFPPLYNCVGNEETNS